jgi:hypothetical protein
MTIPALSMNRFSRFSGGVSKFGGCTTGFEGCTASASVLLGDLSCLSIKGRVAILSTLWRLDGSIDGRVVIVDAEEAGAPLWGANVG